jgi:hypothetical protein
MHRMGIQVIIAKMIPTLFATDQLIAQLAPTLASALWSANIESRLAQPQASNRQLLKLAAPALPLIAIRDAAYLFALNQLAPSNEKYLQHFSWAHEHPLAKKMLANFSAGAIAAYVTQTLHVLISSSFMHNDPQLLKIAKQQLLANRAKLPQGLPPSLLNSLAMMKMIFLPRLLPYRLTGMAIGMSGINLLYPQLQELLAETLP